MQKAEFEKLIEKTVTNEEYEIIEIVYQYHPSVSNTCGKEEVAELYKSFGMVIFLDMLDRAKRSRELEKELSLARGRVRHIEEKMKELANGEYAPLDKKKSEQMQTAPTALEKHFEMQKRMKNGKVPTLEQKKLMRSQGLVPDNWLVVKNLPDVMEVVSRASLKKGGKPKIKQLKKERSRR